MESNEIWKPIRETFNFYSVSNFGKIKSNERTIVRSNGILMSFEEKIITPGISGNGYLTFSAHINNVGITMFVHRCVASAFCIGRKKNLVVNHIDGNKLNNNFKNLEWVTQTYNTKHSFDKLNRKSVNGEKHGNSKLTKQQVLYIKKSLKENPRQNLRILSDKFEVEVATIRNIRNGSSWRHLNVISK